MKHDVTPRGHSIKIPTPESLAKAALHYLSCYAASEHALRRVLENKVQRLARLNSAFAEDTSRQHALYQAIALIIEQHKKSGALNDEAFAETKIHALRRAGRSRRAIQQRLSHKGVAAQVITAMLERHDNDDDPETAEFKAARKLARRRKLGCFRLQPATPERLRKDLAALARAGFGLAIARRALASDLSDEDDV